MDLKDFPLSHTEEQKPSRQSSPGYLDSQNGHNVPDDVIIISLDDVTRSPSDDVTRLPCDDVNNVPFDDVTGLSAEGVTLHFKQVDVELIPNDVTDWEVVSL
jgi:hypothetical protein